MEQYEEIEVIGIGAFGTVTKCRNKKTGMLVAIKKSKQQYASFDECLQLKEVKSLRKIKNENVVKLVQVFRENGHLFMVFELLEESLFKTIHEHNGPFREEEVRYIMTELLKGLSFIHRAGFFHRDIKPENLLWGGDSLKIADFGLARETKLGQPFTEYISTRWYRAPELLLRAPRYGPAVDVWAAGCVCAELLTLRPLFQGSSELDQLYKVCSVLGTPGRERWPDGAALADRLGVRLPSFAPISFGTVLGGASEGAVAFVSSLLALDPEQRPTAAQALQHPWLRGAVERVARPKAREEGQRPTRVAEGSKLAADEATSVAVSSVAPPAAALRARRLAAPSSSSSSSSSDFDF